MHWPPRISRRELSSRELLEHYLDRVERVNAPVNAVVTMDADSAGRPRTPPMRRWPAVSTVARCTVCR
jgi:Asp-tRNA(Asn)/Glu-tRNA(Gln) amidotransferase A subunit family amidase